MSAGLKRKTHWESLGETPGLVSLLILYCAVMFLARVTLGPNFNGAEAREMLFGQSLQWGYRANQPPLAMWLSWAALVVGGGSRLALFLLREMVLAVGLTAFLAVARTVLGDIRRAGLATLFLLATFGMGWRVQRTDLDIAQIGRASCRERV